MRNRSKLRINAIDGHPPWRTIKNSNIKGRHCKYRICWIINEFSFCIDNKKDKDKKYNEFIISFPF